MFNFRINYTELYLQNNFVFSIDYINITFYKYNIIITQSNELSFMYTSHIKGPSSNFVTCNDIIINPVLLFFADCFSTTYTK